MSNVAIQPVTTIVDIPIPREAILGLERRMGVAIDRGVLEDGESFSSWKHSFIPGGYARQMLICKHTLVVGKIHRYPCFNFIMTGHVTVGSEDGIRDMFAPFFFVSQPKAKRVVYAHEETLWITVHGTMEPDLRTQDEIKEVEQKLFADTFEEIESPKEVTA